MNRKMFLFDGFLGFRKSFCGIERAFWNPFLISESGYLYFDKFDFKFSKFFNFSALFSAIVQILHAKQNGIFRLQWFGWRDVKVDIFGCLWVYGKGPPKYRFRFSLLKDLEMVFGPYYIP